MAIRHKRYGTNLLALFGLLVNENCQTYSRRLIHYVGTSVALAVVGVVLLHSNLILQLQIGTIMGGVAYNRYSQGWPMTHRTLGIREQDDLSMGSQTIEPRIIETTHKLFPMFCNLLVGLVLWVSVWATHRLRFRANSKVGQLDLISLFFGTSIFAMIALQIANNYRTEVFLADILVYEPDYLRCFSIPNLHLLIPITYAIACTGYVLLSTVSQGVRFGIRRLNPAPTADQQTEI